jgi:hypothetical protein
MTVEELIKLLQTFDPNSLVIMQRDPEGNGYSPLAGAEDNGAWDSDEGEYGYAQLTPKLKQSGYSTVDCVQGVPAVVLYPDW